ncbi:Gti1/Pac2 family-domain-containing protein [Infundibulicybe gibba]|nr:Gti1/Pac2 family-domain-containing protein [Infundibulicybe gibba]
MTTNPDVPPFTGFVETTVHALRLIHAARQGIIPRITRRLNDTERRTMIRSGAVFVFSVEESGIKRWTDGLLWSPSRIVGNFLVYREINERTSSRGSHKKPYPSEESSSRTLVTRRHSPDQAVTRGHSSSDPGTFKVNGLIKKTITVTIDGSDLHLISYYTSEDARSHRLKPPTSRQDIMSPYLPPHIFRLTNFRVPPKVEMGPDGKPRFVDRTEPEDVEPIDCKSEEAYRTDPPNWMPGHNIHQSPHLQGYSSIQARTSTSQYERGAMGWSLPIPPVGREDSWSPASSPTHSTHGTTRRQGGSILTPAQSWPTTPSQSSRWQEPYEPSGIEQYLNRNNVRGSHPYTGPMAEMGRRNNENAPTMFGSRAGDNTRVGSHPWLNNQDIVQDARSSQPGSSFASPTNLHFETDGSFVSNWTSPPNLQNSLARRSQPYESTYGSGSGAIPSPEEFSGVEEFGEA